MPFYFRKECPLNSGYLKRRHSRLGNISPAAFREKYHQMAVLKKEQVMPLIS
ncbi:hypothetical protein SD1617_5517 [Shigella dysenteriae 1617]|uniref:hypothetical protein n=1 Tax=Shigella dysenteriae TaxID=622 RepID=UPI0001E6B1DC|nr:hypothetical protein [Shigella dysenteriae]EFP68792.1 hypothetical protein SD1617_5517 [Shigella dysenteriae 1617]